MLVSVLILNYRNPQATVACVSALQQQSIADQMEILVIDNHSEDDSIGILRNRLADFANVRIIETPQNNGFGYGYNVGASYAKGRYLLINNPDKLLETRGVEMLADALERHCSVGIVGPKLVHDDDSRRLSMRRFPRIIDVICRRSVLGRLFPGALRRYLMQDVDPEIEHEVDWVVGGCFMVRTEDFLTLGGFDEDFFLFFEDTDFCRRLRQTGKTVLYMPSVQATDKQKRLSGESFTDLLFKKTGRIHLGSAAKYFWKWRGQR